MRPSIFWIPHHTIWSIWTLQLYCAFLGCFLFDAFKYFRNALIKIDFREILKFSLFDFVIFLVRFFFGILISSHSLLEDVLSIFPLTENIFLLAFGILVQIKDFKKLNNYGKHAAWLTTYLKQKTLTVAGNILVNTYIFTRKYYIKNMHFTTFNPYHIRNEWQQDTFSHFHGRYHWQNRYFRQKWAQLLKWLNVTPREKNSW